MEMYDVKTYKITSAGEHRSKWMTYRCIPQIISTQAAR